jgi:integrase
MRQSIQAYINAQQNRWAPTTLRSEAARLQANIDLLKLGPDMGAVHAAAQSLFAPYSLRTLMIRLADYWSFNNEHAPKRWLRENANVFRGAYVREPASITMAEAKTLVAQIGDGDYRALANEILHSGLRASESLGRTGDNVVGKGGRSRRVFYRALLSADQRTKLTYNQLWRELRAVGLKPHTLRKVFATEAARSGKLSEQDLLTVMGWASMQTATSYLAPMREDRLAEILNEVTA